MNRQELAGIPDSRREPAHIGAHVHFWDPLADEELRGTDMDRADEIAPVLLEACRVCEMRRAIKWEMGVDGGAVRHEAARWWP